MPVNPPIMQAIIQDGYGKPERVLRPGEIEVPPIGGDDVLIRMRATSVNAPDWATVTGVPYIGRLSSGLRRPKRPVRGSDVAGVVQAVGDYRNLADHGIGQAVEKVVLVTYVRVEGHRLDAEFLRELTHAE